MRNQNHWIFEAPFVTELSRISRTTIPNTDIKDFGEGKPPNSKPPKSQSPNSKPSEAPLSKELFKLRTQAIAMRINLNNHMRTSSKGKDCKALIQTFERLFSDFQRTTEAKVVYLEATRNAFNTLASGYMSLWKCLQGTSPASAEFEQMEWQLFEVPFSYKSVNYYQFFSNPGNNQQWLFELPYESQEEYSISSESDAMFDSIKKWWEQRKKGKSSTSSTPTTKRNRQIIANELLTARNDLERKAKEYETLNCYDRINMPAKFPVQDLDLQNKCLDLQASMKNLRIKISSLENELKAL